MGTRSHRPDLRSAGRRVQGRRRGGSGQSGDVRVPHPGHRGPAGPAAGGSGDVPAAVTGPHLHHRGHRGGADGVGGTGHVLSGSGGPAAKHDDRRHHRRSRRCGDRRREADRRGDHLVSALASARRAGDHVSVLGKPAAAVVDTSRPTRGAATGSRPHSGRDRGGDSIRDSVGPGGRATPPATSRCTA